MSFGAVTAEAALAFARNARKGHGKFEIVPKVEVRGMEDMAVAYTPGVGHVVRHLLAHPEDLGEYSTRDNLIALVTNGTAVLGYGDTGPHAGVPVMEGKAIMFKMLAGIDCMPLCLDAPDPMQLASIVEALEPSFGGFNLEDVASPGCFAVMERLTASLGVPILHDDQYGTATVVTACLINAARALGRRTEDLRVVVNGVGAAGTAAITMLQALGVGDLIAVDRPGILVRGSAYPHAHWSRIAEETNGEQRTGGLSEALRGADVFIGLSVGGLVTGGMIRSMAEDPIVLSLANPIPEIMPDEAKAAGAAVVASGRFDYPNHCNNVLAFPALMRAALDVKATAISLGMCLTAARAIAAYMPETELGLERLLPSPLDPVLYPSLAEEIARYAIEAGLARRSVRRGEVYSNCRKLIGQESEAGSAR
jgi:malate dehydrogenase (oxaloacetate-decarboxylating)